MRELVVLVALLGCKDPPTKSDPPPPPKSDPGLSKALKRIGLRDTELPPLPPAPIAQLDPPGGQPVFPADSPVIEITGVRSITLWADGTVRLGRCARWGKLPPERIAQLVNALAANWGAPGEGSDLGEMHAGERCASTTVRLTHEGTTRGRKGGGCTGNNAGRLDGTVGFVEDVVGPDPC